LNIYIHDIVGISDLYVYIHDVVCISDLYICTLRVPNKTTTLFLYEQ